MSPMGDGAAAAVATAEGAAHPRQATRLWGHAAAVATLAEAVASGRFPHAWILSGPPGIGKATLAFRLARVLLTPAATPAPPAAADAATPPAEQDDGPGLFDFGAAPAAAPPPQAPQPPAPAAAAAPRAPEIAAILRGDAPAPAAGSPTAGAWRRIAVGSHGDLRVIAQPVDEKTGRTKAEIPADAVRAIPPFLRLTAMEGGWRVVIIDGADTMNLAAQNALLKILEEPPARAVLLLVTQNLGRLLPTIRSRCRLLSLSALADATIAEALAHLAPGVAPERRRVAAALGEGSIARALDLLDEEQSALMAVTLGLLTGFGREDALAVHTLAAELSAPEADDRFRQVMRLAEWWLSRLARAQARGGWPPPLTDTDADALARMAAAAPGLDRLVSLWETTRTLIAETEHAHLDRRQLVLTLHRLYRRALPLPQ